MKKLVCFVMFMSIAAFAFAAEPAMKKETMTKDNSTVTMDNGTKTDTMKK